MSGFITYGSFSDATERAVLAAVLKKGPNYVANAATWVALFTSVPTDAAAGTEPGTGIGYARQSANFVDAADLADGSSAVSNDALVQFPTATSDWGPIAYMGVFTLVTAGVFLLWAPLQAPRTILAGDAPRFPTGTLLLGLR